MSFLKYAQLFIPELTNLPVTVCGEKGHTLRAFAEKACFSSEIQPLYTEDGFRSFFAQKEHDRIYEITDALGTRMIVFRTNGQTVIFGPYVTTPWEEPSSKILLAKCGCSAEQLLSYKAYRCELPLVENHAAEKAAFFVLEHLVPAPDFVPVCIELSAQKMSGRFPRISEAYSDAEIVNRNYADEKKLMDTIRKGDTVQILHCLQDWQAPPPGIRFLTNSLNDKIAQAFAIRVLVRHAALQAGLTPVFVDALSQEYAQKMHRAISKSELDDLMRQYAVAFCQAVRDNRKMEYSPYVKRAVQWIESKLSQPVTVNDLCRLNNITRQHFSQLFKKETGKTVKQYIMQARCDRAAELLMNSDLPIRDISQYVGYEDAAYFARVFKNVTGHTPQEYRLQPLIL